MTIGSKIKIIRKFRGMTQKELGEAVNLGINAAKRIAQYEIDYRVPRYELLVQISSALNVNIENFCPNGSINELIFSLLWLDEDEPDCVHMFPMWRRSSCNDYPDNEYGDYKYDKNWPPRPPTGVCFHNTELADFFAEWMERKEELKINLITRNQYFEWKINWPYTSWSRHPGGDERYVDWTGNFTNK